MTCFYNLYTNKCMNNWIIFQMTPWSILSLSPAPPHLPCTDGTSHLTLLPVYLIFIHLLLVLVIFGHLLLILIISDLFQPVIPILPLFLHCLVIKSYH